MSAVRKGCAVVDAIIVRPRSYRAQAYLLQKKGLRYPQDFPSPFPHGAYTTTGIAVILLVGMYHKSFTHYKFRQR